MNGTLDEHQLSLMQWHDPTSSPGPAPLPRPHALTFSDVTLVRFRNVTAKVVLSTILFLLIFVCGTSWTMAVNKQFEGKPNTFRYWAFAVLLTFLVMTLSVLFGEMARFAPPAASAASFTSSPPRPVPDGSKRTG